MQPTVLESSRFVIGGLAITPETEIHAGRGREAAFDGAI